MKRLTWMVVAVITAVGVTLGAQSNSARTQLEAAKKTEVVDGDLKGAIDRYKKIVATTGVDRSVAAEALVRMAECYQKLGDSESRRIYERILRDYADQKDAVATASAQLGGSRASAGMNSRLVWSGSKVDDEGTVSPDGRYASFTNWDTGNLMLHEFATGADRQITTDAPDAVNGRWRHFAEESAISRDGKEVAYSWWNANDNRYDLRLASLTASTNPRRLYDNAEIRWIMPFDWSPDSRLIAVETDRVDHTNQLGVMTVADGSLRVLKSVEWRKAGRMFFSPNGRWLGYDIPESADRPEHHVAVLAVDGTRELHVDHHGQDQMVGWSRDGNWLLFSSDRTGSTDLWAVPFADSGSLGTPQLLKTGFEGAKALGVTTSGTLFYAQPKGGGRSRIETASIDIGAGKLAGAPIELPQSSQDSYKNPAWSPDGTRLAYLSERGPLNAKTYVIAIRSIDTGQVRELRPSLNYLVLSSWSPDGHALLVTGRDFKGRMGVYLVDAETGDAKPMGPDEKFLGNVYRAAWAPDGRSFLVERGEGLYRINLATGAASEVVPAPPTQGSWGLYPWWAPDGKAIYYQHVFKSKDGAIEECAVVERDLGSGTDRELIRKSGAVCIAIPSADGQYVVTDGTDAATNSRVVLLIPVHGGQPRELLRVAASVKPDALNNPNLGEWPFIARVTADSRSVLVVKRRGDRAGSLISGKDPSELWLVPPGGGEPKKVTALPVGLDSIAVSQNGQQVAFTVSDAGSRPNTELWALENFMPQAKAGSPAK